MLLAWNIWTIELTVRGAIMSRHGLGFFHQRYYYSTQRIYRQSQLVLMARIAQKKQNRRGAYRRFVFTNNVAPKYNLLVLNLWETSPKNGKTFVQYSVREVLVKQSNWVVNYYLWNSSIPSLNSH